MTIKSVELRQKRADQIAQARKLYEERSKDDQLSAEDQAQFDRLMDTADELREEAERIERMETAEADIETRQRANGRRPDPNDGRPEPAAVGRRSAEYAAAFDTYISRGTMQLNQGEIRALQADNDTLGGYLVTPERILDRVIKAVDDEAFIRQFATVFTVTDAASLGAASVDADPADADWTTEIQTVTEDSTMAMGKRVLNPSLLTKVLKVSEKLLRLAPGSAGLVADRLGYKFGITWEKAGLTGSGSGQPLGVFTAHADGVTTARDVSTDNAATAVTANGLINAKYHLKGQYWPRARWIAHRDFYKMVSKLVNAEGQYLWRESLRAGEPDRLLGFPAHMSEYAPNTFTSALYVGILGDFSQYWIADAQTFAIRRLDELYAATNQIGFKGMLESDGMPVLAEAFARVKLG